MPSQIALDIDFARQSPEFFGRLTALLRYVVALNPDATKAEFVKEATTRGYNATTPANISNTKWHSDSDDGVWLSRGLCHLTREAAEQHAAALLAVNRGE